MSPPPCVSVCVVNYRGERHLPPLLEALPAAAAGRSFEVVVVDNGSRAALRDRVLAEHPDLRWLANARNRGYARGCNQAAAAARGRYLLFLNNDAAPSPGAIASLATLLEGRPEAAAAGPRLEGPDGRPQPSCGPLPTTRGLLHRVLFLRWTGAFRGAHRAYRRAPAPAAAGPVGWVGGAALLVRRQALAAIGGWDEGFAFGLEDVDLCARLAAAGQVLHAPEARVVHAGGVDSETNLPWVYRRFEWGYARFVRKHDPRPWAAPLYKGCVTLDAPLRLLASLLRLLREALTLRGRERVRRAARRAAAVAAFAFLGLPGLWRA